MPHIFTDVPLFRYICKKRPGPSASLASSFEAEPVDFKQFDRAAPGAPVTREGEPEGLGAFLDVLHIAFERQPFPFPGRYVQRSDRSIEGLVLTDIDMAADQRAYPDSKFLL